MNTDFRRLERLLHAEVSHYQCLVVLARAKHCLLRAGRGPEAVRLADIESLLLAHLELFDVTRRALVQCNPPNALQAATLRRMEQTKVDLIRQLRPIARANRAFDARRIAAIRAARLSALMGDTHFRPTRSLPNDAA